MKRYDVIVNRIKNDYTRPGQTAEPVFETMLEAFETRQEADDFANACFNSRLGL